jgi:hypothetical protein
MVVPDHVHHVRSGQRPGRHDGDTAPVEGGIEADFPETPPTDGSAHHLAEPCSGNGNVVGKTGRPGHFLPSLDAGTGHAHRRKQSVFHGQTSFCTWSRSPLREHPTKRGYPSRRPSTMALNRPCPFGQPGSCLRGPGSGQPSRWSRSSSVQSRNRGGSF